MANSSALKSLLGKPRTLTTHEDPTSFDSWIESITFHVSLSDKSTRFLPTGDLNTWSVDKDRGFQDDGDEAHVTPDNKMNKTAKAALLNLVLGSIAGFAPVISSKFIKNQSTSLESIWNRPRSYYGFRRTGSRILDLTDIKLELNETRESLWERLYSFLEDQLLTKTGGILHNNVKQEKDEEFTPTLLNVLVTHWLHIINPALPAVVKQRFSTNLRTCTLFSIREEVSDAIPVILTELEEKESIISRAGSYQRYSSSQKYKPKGKQSNFTKRNCCLCDALGKQASHFLSTCPYLPAEDKKFMSKTREISMISDEEESEEEFPSSPAPSSKKVHNRKITSSSSPLCDIRRVDVCASPAFEVLVNNLVSTWTCDSGAEANCMEEAEAQRLGLEIIPTSQGATQGDGKTPLNTVGEVHFVARRGHHKLKFSGLVVKHLDTSVLAGMPFHMVNDIQINYSLCTIILEDCCRIKFNPEKKPRKSAKALRVARQTCILPGEAADFQLPDDLRTEDFVALEPRTTVPNDMPPWIKCGIYSPDAEGTISVTNESLDPVIIGKHVQVCQVRPTVDPAHVLAENNLPTEIKPSARNDTPHTRYRNFK